MAHLPASNLGKTLSKRSSGVVVILWFLNEARSSSLVMICGCDDLSDICVFLDLNFASGPWSALPTSTKRSVS